VLLGSPDEKNLCDSIEESLKPNTVLTNLAGKTNLAEMIALLSRAKFIIGNDSGPLHVATALGRPCVAIYGPTSENFVGPYGQLENVIRHNVECHPCRRKTCDHHSCMKGVTVEVVWAKALKVAEEKR
jgi:heptosyltransferase-2